MSENKFKRFLDLKSELKVNKTIWNKFGQFHYRNKESILEAVKPLEKKHNLLIQVTDDELELIGNKYFTVATAYVIDIESGEQFLHTKSRAELQPRQGTQMNESQLTGSASSYAGKYALQNLLGLDDNKDADSDEQHPKNPENKKTIKDVKEVKEDTPTQQVANKKQLLEATKQRVAQLNEVTSLESALKYVVETLGGDEEVEKLIKTKIEIIKGDV